MKIKRILALTLAAVLVLTAALAGCSGNTASSGSGDNAASTASAASTGGDTSGVEQVLYLAQPELATWDSATCVDSESGTILSNVMEGLCQYHYTDDGQATFELAGATSYDVSDDGLVYTYHLVEDAVWSDGVPVTANDYVYAAKRLLDGELAAPYEFFAASIAGAQDYYDSFSKIWNSTYYICDEDGDFIYNDAGEKQDRNPTDEEVAAAEAEIEALDFDSNVGVKAIDDYTLEFTLAYADAQFYYKAGFQCFFPLREDIVSPIYDTYGDNWEDLVFNGPFMVTDWVDKSYGVLEKNPTYWDADSVTLERIELSYVNEDATKDKLFKEGQLDLLSGAGDYLEEYKEMAENGECQYLYSEYAAATQSITFNKKTGGPSGIISNSKVAKAIAYSIDNVEWCDTIYGHNSPAYGYVPGDLGVGDLNYRDTAGYPAWKEEREEYTGNPEKLQELLKEGLTELGLQTDDLSQYTVTYMTYGDSSRQLQMQEFVQQSVESNLGINLKLNICSGWAEFLTNSSDYSLWDMTMAGWVGDYAEPMTFMECQASSQSSNWENPEYDALIEQARNELDPEKRIAIYRQAEDLICEESPIIPVMHTDTNNFLTNRVKGLMVGNIGYQWYCKFASVTE